MFDRVLAEDAEMFGVSFQKGASFGAVWIPYLHNPETFEKPLEFIPERWEKEEVKQHQQLVDLIFAGGPRGCIGKNLAMTEMKVLMIKFIKRYASLVEPGIQERAIRMLVTVHIPNSEVVLTRRT
jgi:cytochrome P450